MSDATDRVLDKENWRCEAESVIKDVRDHVKNASVSENVECDDRFVYLNLETLEEDRYCVELSANGFRIVGSDFDSTDGDVENEEYFETPYGLLNKISPLFKDSFGNALINKLKTV